MNRYLLGLNVGNHDSAAALIKNGELVCFLEQERISRHKMAIGEPPIDAALACLQRENITIRDVSAVAIGMDWHYRNEVYQMPTDELNKYRMFADTDWFLPQSIFGQRLPPVIPVRHHLAHAASAYRVSGFNECAVLVIDNRGEDSSTSLGVAQNGEIAFFRKINIHNSLGIFYNHAARFAGLYGKYREVGKFMGLASYGMPNVPVPLSPSRDGLLFKALPDIERRSIHDAIGLRTIQFKAFFENNCFPYETGNVEEIMSYADFAASVQHALELTILDFVAELKERTGMDNLVIAGGVALNCSANGRIEQSGLFRHVFVPPFASDSGTAVGAAMEVYHKLYGKPYVEVPLRYAGLGLSYSQTQTEQTLQRYADRISWRLCGNAELYSHVAQALASGSIVGWMQDGFEAGPRSLGFRSILADPRTRRNLIRLNQIKQREMWRPIAPSVLYEAYSTFFKGFPDSKYFMNVAAVVKEEKRKGIAAVVHVDHTARPQVVKSEQKRYYALLKAFGKLTGVPVLCNTSFNCQGEPLVNTPEDALECFLKRDIDMLVIGNYVIRKVQ
jgi:carbamoyltransferase